MGKTYRDGQHGGKHTRGQRHNNDGYIVCDLYGTDACIDCDQFRSCNFTKSSSGKKANTKLKRKLQARKEPLYTDDI